MGKVEQRYPQSGVVARMSRQVIQLLQSEVWEALIWLRLQQLSSNPRCPEMIVEWKRLCQILPS